MTGVPFDLISQKGDFQPRRDPRSRSVRLQTLIVVEIRAVMECEESGSNARELWPGPRPPRPPRDHSNSLAFVAAYRRHPHTQHFACCIYVAACTLSRIYISASLVCWRAHTCLFFLPLHHSALRTLLIHCGTQYLFAANKLQNGYFQIIINVIKFGFQVMMI